MVTAAFSEGILIKEVHISKIGLSNLNPAPLLFLWSLVYNAYAIDVFKIDIAIMKNVVCAS